MEIFTTFIILIQCVRISFAQLSGCTDPLATNFNPNATINNGTCVYSSQTVLPDTSIILPDVFNETSGLIFYDQKLVMHNDDTDKHLYQFAFLTPENYASIQLPFTNVDWEDIDQDDAYIYVGDIGNNVSGNRTNLRIYRVEKSILSTTPVVDTISFHYELQTDYTNQTTNSTNFDCEAFIVTADKIYLFTKEWGSKKTSLYELDKTPGSHTAIYKGTWDCQGLITGATYYSDKKLVVLSGYSVLLQPFVVLLYDYQNTDFFNGNKRKINLNLPYHQIEGITTENGLSYYLTNEKFVQGTVTIPAKVHSLNLEPFLSLYFSENQASLTSPAHASLKLYPNPITDELTIQLSSTNQEGSIELYNQLGELVLIHSITNEDPIIRVATNNLSKGIYTIFIRTNDGSIVAQEQLVK